MTQRSPYSVQSALGVMVLGRLLVACFDVEQVDVHTTGTKPAALLIDDFDDGDRQPELDSLELWHCFGVGGTAQAVRCDVGQGVNGTNGRAITFELFDVPDGRLDNRGAELQVSARVPLDLTRYERLVFWAALELGGTESSILVVLYCGDDGLLDNSFRLRPGAPFAAFSTLMTAFHQPTWQKELRLMQGQPLVVEAACLAQVYGVSIVLQPALGDGQEAKGTALVDEIYAQ